MTHTIDREIVDEYVATVNTAGAAVKDSATLHEGRMALTAHEPWDKRYREYTPYMVRYIWDYGAPPVGSQAGMYPDRYPQPAPEIRYVLIDAAASELTGAGFLIDDGQTVTPYYVAAYRVDPDHTNPYTGELVPNWEIDPHLIL